MDAPDRPLRHRLRLALAGVAALCLAHPGAARSQSPAAASAADAQVVEARDAFRKRDRARLAVLKAQVAAVRHPLAPWVDYWELNARLADSSIDEVEAFYARWPGSYVEDRLRNDWLLELGRRRDWPAFARDLPRFRMADDREVKCYAVMLDQAAGRAGRDEARAAWFAQKEADDGCTLMAGTLLAARVLGPDDVYAKARLAVEANRPKAAGVALGLLPALPARDVADAIDNPVAFLGRRAGGGTRPAAELALLALMRAAANAPDVAARLLEERWARELGAERAALAWAFVARQSAQKLAPEAADQFKTAWQLLKRHAEPGFSDETLGWQVRSALRNLPPKERWPAVRRAIEAMSAGEQADPAWIYWKARAIKAQARPGDEGEAERAEADRLLASIASPLGFYGALALEALGQPLLLPPAPAALTAAEREAARSQPGFARALQMIALGLRSEGVREWNFHLRGLGDRELLAAAQLACEREVWDRCINTSERTRGEIDLRQRYPTPFRASVEARARESGLDPALVYGLIRQESRFITDARSGVGATGLMQLMPATARWTARKLGLEIDGRGLGDHDLNLRLGTGYLKRLLDDFNGSAALATAAYNAGPGRPRRWRDGPTLEPAIWAENVPFAETRDYVKKVLGNTVVYGALLAGTPTMLSLVERLGPPIGPRPADAPPPSTELP